jgi:peptidoglycan/xylan/chitin deacetylase (PgdA/CDA1 family)
MKEYFLYPICKVIDLVMPQKYKKGIPILLYHSIGNKDSRLAVGEEEFEKQINFLAKKGYKTITPKDLFHSSENNKRILITFDDGFKDNLINALPVLKKYGYIATIFISTNYIGGKSEFCTNKNDREFNMLDETDIKNLEENNWNICNHFHSHKNLTELNDQKIIEEFLKARNILRAIIKYQGNADIISFPRNKYNDNIQKVLKKIGVVMAFAGNRKMYFYGNDIMALPRIEIDKDVNFIKFKLYFSPSFYFLKSLLQK